MLFSYIFELEALTLVLSSGELLCVDVGSREAAEVGQPCSFLLTLSKRTS